MKKTIRKRLASLEDATASEIMALAEQLNNQIEDEDDDVELDDELDIDEDSDLEDLEDAEDEVQIEDEDDVTDADFVPDDEDIIGEQIDAAQDQLQAAEVIQGCDELSAKIASIEKQASETKSGIEDTIGDEAHGGDPSTSEVAPGGDDVDVSTDKQVFPTNSEYVASITKRLDRVASVLEKRGMKRMAFRIDKLSDQLEASVR